MIDAEAITYFFGTAAGVWMLGYSWGKAVAWVRHLTNAA
jgi:hypothetical protein